MLSAEAMDEGLMLEQLDQKIEEAELDIKNRGNLGPRKVVLTITLSEAQIKGGRRAVRGAYKVDIKLPGPGTAPGEGKILAELDATPDMFAGAQG